ncbi:MAG TPA: hypothetical protein VKU85_20860, partial [bacterium]|nr:hypothetical protein [bacterium]
HNTLDMYVEENGNRFVKHHLIDFASTLGSGASGASPKYNWEYGFDGPATLRRLVTLGLVEDEWRTFERPEDLPEVGYFESEPFAVSKFEPLTPNSAFARMTDRDGYWAAKIVSGFSNRILTATTRTAGYENPDVAPYLARVLAERRDIIARDYFTRVCPVDFFRVRGGHLAATDLGVDRGIWDASATSYRVRQWPVDPERNATADIGGWTAVDVPEVGLGEGGAPYRAVEFQVDRGDGWGPSVIVYVAAASGRVVGVER